MAPGEDQDLEYKTSLGRKIVEIRKQKGLNQKQLAEALNISATRLNYWEKGKAAPTTAFIDQIATVLGVSVPTLLGWDELDSFKDYLSSIGYAVTETVTKWHTESEDQGNSQIPDEIQFEVCALASGKKYAFTSNTFDDFRLSIKKAVEFALFQSEK